MGNIYTLSKINCEETLKVADNRKGHNKNETKLLSITEGMGGHFENDAAIYFQITRQK